MSVQPTLGRYNANTRRERECVHAQLGAAVATADVNVPLQLLPAHVSLIEYCLEPAAPLNVLSVLIIPHRAACVRLASKLSAHYWRLAFPLALQSNNDITVPPIGSPMGGPVTIRPHVKFTADTADQVQREALNQFHATAFTSYTELRPENPALLLVLRRRDEVWGVPTVGPTPNNPVTTESPQQMPLTMQLFTSPDYRLPLDPSAKVQSDRRIYAEVSQPVTQWFSGCCSFSQSFKKLFQENGSPRFQT